MEAAWKEAFRQYGVLAANHVHGAFAAAFSPKEGVHYLAVDRFAKKTLAYRFEGGILEISDRADQLVQTDDPLDPQAVYGYFRSHVIHAPRTIFSSVKRVQAGHYVLISGRSEDTAPYWLARFAKRSNSFETLAMEFSDLLCNAVKKTLPDAGKVGCFLSGGTDSSTVAGVASRLLGRGVDTYSIGFAVEGYDESRFADIAAKHFGTRHHQYYITPDDLVKGIPLVAAHYDQPFGNSSALPGYYCAKMAREDGVDVLLAGDGGDELFGGNSRYAKQKIFEAYKKIPRFIRHELLEPIAPSVLSGPSLLRKIGSYITQSSVSMPARAGLNGLLSKNAWEIFTPGLLSGFDMVEPLRQEQTVWNRIDGGFVEKMLAYDWRYTLAENDLPKVCGTTALAGVDVAFPLLDDDLLEFSMGLGEDYKVRGMKLRWFFKKALTGFLPAEILAKKKHGFGLPFGQWVLSHDALRELAVDSMQGLCDRGLIRRSAVHNLMNHQMPQHPGYYGEMVWIMMMLEQWLRARKPSFKV